MPAPYLIDPDNPEAPFPDIGLALTEPDGLLAVGGDLSVSRLLNAYCNGIFPWYSEGQPILWWSPDPRLVLTPGKLKISRSLQKTIRKRPFTITIDKAFRDVISACAEPRPDQDGTWIVNEMKNAYIELHKAGFAHSIEAWQDNKLVGGLYGIAIGRVFFGESMFARVTDASKVAFCYFVQQLDMWGFTLIDCQVYTTHLASLGAFDMDRSEFRKLLDIYCQEPGYSGSWQRTLEQQATE